VDCRTEAYCQNCGGITGLASPERDRREKSSPSSMQIWRWSKRNDARTSRTRTSLPCHRGNP